MKRTAAPVRKADANPVVRIGSRKSLTFNACVDAIRAPFEERLKAFLDFLYSEGRPGVASKPYAQVLLRRWLDLSITHDPESSYLHAYWRAVARCYPDPKSLKPRDRTGASLGRKAAEDAMRTPFEKVLCAYIARIFDPGRPPGIRDEAHALETFVTFAKLFCTYGQDDAGE